MYCCVAFALIGFTLFPMARLSSYESELPADLVFIPDTGLRIDNASNVAPSVGDDGVVYLFYEKHKGKLPEPGKPGRGEPPGPRPEQMMSWSGDGLAFDNAVPRRDPRVDRRRDPRLIHIPDGSWREYIWDMRAEEFISITTRDGVHFTRDPGTRYRGNHSSDPCEEDNDSIGIYDLFWNDGGELVMLYLGDNRGPYDSVRRAVSRDRGDSFEFDRGNVLGDCYDVGERMNHVDQKHIILPGGRVRLFTMVGGGGPPQPGARRCCRIHSWISDDGGDTFAPEPGVRLAPEDFTGFDVYSLNDPWVVRLRDGRYRMYVTALIFENGERRQAIVSATTVEEGSR